MRYQNGFSLVECMVCISLFSFLTTFAVFSVRPLKNRIVFRNEIFELVRGLYLGKMAAVKHNCPVVFEINEDGYNVFVDDGGVDGKMGDWKKQKGEALLLKKTLPQEIKIYTNFTKKRMRFNCGFGNKAGRIILHNNLNGSTVEVVLSVSGRVRVTKS